MKKTKREKAMEANTSVKKRFFSIALAFKTISLTKKIIFSLWVLLTLTGFLACLTLLILLYFWL